MINSQPGVFFCFGIGYSAQHLIERLLRQGWKVGGTCRSPQKRDELRRRGIDAYCFSPDEDEFPPPEAYVDADHVLSSIPPSESGDPVMTHLWDALDWSRLKWIGYLSTTGVYGDHDGQWVDESASLLTTEPRLLRRIEAERRWLALPTPAHIFRLAGIYGPGRSAVDQAEEGQTRRIYKDGQFFSRIHVDDITKVLLAAIRRPLPGEIFNVCDDEPAPSHVVVEYASLLIGVEPPPLIRFEDAELSQMGRSFYMNNRRMSNSKLKDKLRIELDYPTYREGLQSIARLRHAA